MAAFVHNETLTSQSLFSSLKTTVAAPARYVLLSEIMKLLAALPILGTVGATVFLPKDLDVESPSMFHPFHPVAG